MTNHAITAEGLGKRYLLGQRDPYKTMSDSLAKLPRRLFGRRRLTPSRREALWALRDASFLLPEGQALGVIGHNGAGKSTLLKLLSRVTAPTVGRAVVYGRVCALLEVGTGFHPELTGKENVFLNGSILGMSRAEIQRKLDDIVTFAGVPQFIDTPVKRFSSGMQMRLAFAIAAHVEPEILIIDEVLAVGDAAFQRRCLNRMNSVSADGRTVVFVSHNLPAVRGLCSRAILVNSGRIVFDGPVEQAISEYNALYGERADSTTDLEKAVRPLETGGALRFRSVQLLGAIRGVLQMGEPLRVRLTVDVHSVVQDAVIVLNMFSADELLVAQSVTTNAIGPIRQLGPGRYTIEGLISTLWLQPGQYTVGVGAWDERGVQDHLPRTAVLHVQDPTEYESPWFAGPGGYLRLPMAWEDPVSTGIPPGEPLESTDDRVASS